MCPHGGVSPEAGVPLDGPRLMTVGYAELRQRNVPDEVPSHRGGGPCAKGGYEPMASASPRPDGPRPRGPSQWGLSPSPLSEEGGCLAVRDWEQTVKTRAVAYKRSFS